MFKQVKLLGIKVVYARHGQIELSLTN